MNENHSGHPHGFQLLPEEWPKYVSNVVEGFCAVCPDVKLLRDTELPKLLANGLAANILLYSYGADREYGWCMCCGCGWRYAYRVLSYTAPGWMMKGLMGDVYGLPLV